MKRKEKYYALYKGDTYLCGGSKDEIIKFLNCTECAFSHYYRPSYRKRLKKDSKAFLVIEVK